MWTYAKNMPGGWLILTLPIWFIGAVLLLLRGLARGVFRPTWNGFMAGLAGLGPMLKSRRELRKRRKARVSDIAAAFTWNPFAYLGRQIDVRPFQGPNSD